MKAFKMAQPTTLEGARAVGADSFDGSAFLAGGTDLVAMLKEYVATPDMVVNLKGIAALRGIRATERGIEIGALTTLAELGADDAVASGWPAIRTTIERSATPQVRNVATVAGNLCQRPRCHFFRNEHYECAKRGGEGCYARESVHEHHAIFDNAVCSAPHVSNLAPVLIAYDALVEIATEGGPKTMPVGEFFVGPVKDVRRENVLGPRDLVTAIILPAAGRNPKSAYVEARQKQSYDWALAGATASLRLAEDGTVADCRIVLNAVAPTPLRRPDLEARIKGKKLTEGRLNEVCEAAAEGATPLRDNAYKTIMVKAVLRRALRRAMEA
ncbi:MAG: FAD binding domain-containing protein [Planctomycetota bacterium]